MKALITVDVEAHRVIDEISGSQHDSLGTILEILAINACEATFFVDFCEVLKWGESFIRATCERILAGGHDIQLHVHPHHFSGDHSRWLLSDYSKAEQTTIILYAIQQYRTILGKDPTAFRAGGFGLNNDTIEILRVFGLRVDCSYLLQRSGCNIHPDDPIDSSPYRGVIEMPLTPVVLMGTANYRVRVSCLDFNWIPLFALKSISTRLHHEDSPTAVFLLHSSSMYVRVGRTRLYYRRSHEKKLHGLIRFLKEQGVVFAKVSSTAQSDKMESRGGTPRNLSVLRGWHRQYAVLFFQAVVGFGISAKFRFFIALNLLAVVATVFLIHYFINN